MDKLCESDTLVSCTRGAYKNEIGGGAMVLAGVGGEEAHPTRVACCCDPPGVPGGAVIAPIDCADSLSDLSSLAKDAKPCLWRGGARTIVGGLSLSCLSERLPNAARERELRCVCSNSNTFSGELRSQQSVQCSLASFLGAARALRSGGMHELLADTVPNLYLAQCVIKAVAEVDVDLPEAGDLFLARDTDDVFEGSPFSQANLWINLAGSRTGLHYDAYNNTLCVAEGQKRVLLLAPSETRWVRPKPVFAAQTNHCAVNAFRHRESRFVGVPGATQHSVVVSAGDVLFIPEGWWHAVESAPVTVAVNLWFDGSRSALVPPLLTSVDPRAVPGGSLDCRAGRQADYHARVLLEHIIAREALRRREEFTSAAVAKVRDAVPASRWDGVSPLLVPCGRAADSLTGYEDRPASVIGWLSETGTVDGVVLSEAEMLLISFMVPRMRDASGSAVAKKRRRGSHGTPPRALYHGTAPDAREAELSCAATRAMSLRTLARTLVFLAKEHPDVLRELVYDYWDDSTVEIVTHRWDACDEALGVEFLAPMYDYVFARLKRAGASASPQEDLLSRRERSMRDVCRFALYATLGIAC